MNSSWYWTKGLHDAEVIDIKKIDFQYDYTQKAPVRNMLEIILDTKIALFDTSIKSIRFYNYKVLEGNEDIIHSWWVKDEFFDIKGKKSLKIYLLPKRKLVKY